MQWMSYFLAQKKTREKKVWENWKTLDEKPASNQVKRYWKAVQSIPTGHQIDVGKFEVVQFPWLMDKIGNSEKETPWLLEWGERQCKSMGIECWKGIATCPPPKKKKNTLLHLLRFMSFNPSPNTSIMCCCATRVASSLHLGSAMFHPMWVR